MIETQAGCCGQQPYATSSTSRPWKVVMTTAPARHALAGEAIRYAMLRRAIVLVNTGTASDG